MFKGDPDALLKETLLKAVNTNDASNLTPPSGGASPPPAEFQPLDPRVVKLWRIHHLINSAILLGLLLIPAGITAVNVEGSFLWMLGFWLLLAAFRLILLFWWPPKNYRAWGYRLDGRVLETRHGVWIRTVQLLPLNRLQHVDLESGPFARMLGLASLLLHTAGTHQATIAIPGLDAGEAARLRDHLVTLGGDDGV